MHVGALGCWGSCALMDWQLLPWWCGGLGMVLILEGSQLNLSADREHHKKGQKQSWYFQVHSSRSRTVHVVIAGHGSLDTEHNCSVSH